MLRLLRLRRPAAVAATLATAVALLGACSGRPDEVEHRALESAPKQLSDTGPPAGRFDQSWQTTVRPHVAEFPPQVRLLGRHVVVSAADGVDAIDARTGRRSWHYREPGRRLVGVAVTRGVLVASFDSTGGEFDRHIVGLDADTGELLWENGKDWSLVTDDVVGRASAGTEPGNRTGVVIVTPVGDDSEHLGIDARTGDELWSVENEKLFEYGCEPKPPTRHTLRRDAVSLGMLECTTQEPRGGGPRPDESVDQEVAVDAETGALLWSTPADTPDIVTRGGVTLTRKPGTDRPRLVGSDGRVLFTGGVGTSCVKQCRLFATGGRVVLTYTANHGERLALVDPRRGRLRSIASPADGPVSYAAAGGRFYLSGGSLADEGFGAVAFLLPNLLSVVDVRTGRVTRTPAPYARQAAPTPGRRWPTYLLGAVGGRLLAVDLLDTGREKKALGADTVRVTGYTSAAVDEPIALGGVAPEEWPAPCRLFAGIRTKRGDHGESSPRDPIHIGGRPVQAGCHRYGTDLDVMWVARTEEEAARLFGSGTGRFGADQARVLDEDARDRRILRVGRVVVQLTTYTSCDFEPCYDSDTVARAVAKNLRAQGY